VGGLRTPDDHRTIVQFARGQTRCYPLSVREHTPTQARRTMALPRLPLGIGGTPRTKRPNGWILGQYTRYGVDSGTQHQKNPYGQLHFNLFTQHGLNTDYELF